MIAPNVTREWHILLVRSRNEKTIASRLEAKGYEVFLPLKACQYDGRTRVRYVPVWAGVVFCRFGRLDKMMIEMTPGVFSVLSFGEMISIPESTVNALRHFSGANYEERAGCLQGDTVRLGEDPAVEGILLETGRYCRVAVNVEALDCCLVVRVPAGALAPAPVLGSGNAKASNLPQTGPESR